MKPVFTPEVAQELGYQKYWPEKKDWAIGFGIAVVVAAIFAGAIVAILMLTGNWERQFQTPTCADYANRAIKDLPARCAAEYGVGNLK